MSVRSDQYVAVGRASRSAQRDGLPLYLKQKAAQHGVALDVPQHARVFHNHKVQKLHNVAKRRGQLRTAV